MFYTLRFFGGRHPLCGSGVTSTISDTSIPLAWIARIADSRPLPGPLTYTFAFLIPRSNATFAQSVAAICAAYGVFFFEPLKPIFPAEDQEITCPVWFVMEIMMLLKDE